MAGAMLVYLGFAGDVIFSYGVFLPSMCEELDWSRAALSGPYTALWIVFALFQPLAGISVSKFGARKNIFWGNFVVILGLLGMSLIKEVWHVYLSFSVLTGAGIAFGAFLPATTIVTDWFTKRRPLTMSLLFVAGGVGGLAFPPLISYLISSLGWRPGWICLAGIHLILLLIGIILIRNKPEEIGQVPDGEATEATQETGVSGATPAGRTYHTAVEWKTRDALRTPALWFILIFATANLFTLNLVTLHQVVYLQDLGFTLMIAATTISLLAGMSIIGELVCGALGTRFESRYLAAVCLAGFTVGIIILMNARALPVVFLYAILSGISYGGLLVLMPVMLGAYFGRTYYAQIAGWAFLVTNLVGATSPLFAGFIYDTTGSYIPAFVTAAAFLSVGLVCALLARPPKPPLTISR